jgi:fanconi anemia group J protein
MSAKQQRNFQRNQVDVETEEDINVPLKVQGFDVFFPHGKRPFPPQLAVMSKALTALRNGNSALLESPTGTGKTLALLCSSLAWQRSFRAKIADHAEAMRAYKQASTLKYEGSEPESLVLRKPRRPQKVPQIFFVSRTHSQLSQAVSELKKLPNSLLKDFGGLRMTILASRKHMCTHPMATKSKNIDEDCRKMHSERVGGACALESRAFAARAALPPGTVWDIEELVQVGRKVAGCSYYASRGETQTKAHVVFAPYNYLVDAGIRRAMDINLKGPMFVLKFHYAHSCSICPCACIDEPSSQDLLLSLVSVLVYCPFNSLSFCSIR